ncbi:MAG: TonB-dependent receptor [Bacteroidota bacterium]|nr:TonB-dependent receptor [Bacteroidota bacterium]
MKKQFVLSLFSMLCLIAMAQGPADSTHIVKLNEVVVNSLKETSPQQTPVSSTTLTSKQLNAAQINNIRDISGIVPNFFIPDYGSAMSTTSYIRGIGSRNSGQSVALYVDNVPYFDKSTFDFDFYDIKQIEVLRGAQGTLYGRNAESGIINIYTLSPLNYQGTKLSLSLGNYGLINGKLAHYGKITDNFGYAVSGYYNHDDGFFTNKFTNKSADKQTSAGGRIKLEWNITPDFKAQYTANFDHIDQNAFPYGAYDPVTGKTAQPEFNDPSTYNRNMLNNSLFLQYKTNNWILSSITSHQYFKDDMKMDNDFTPMSFFSLGQAQKQNAFNEELILKSNSNSHYQWSFGATGFIQHLDMNAPFNMESDAIKYMLQPTFTSMGMTITDPILATPGLYNTETTGGALFHQSTYNNLFVNGLSLTAGLRVDYEKIDLDYNTGSTMNIAMGPATFLFADTLKDNLSVHFSELLPKIALKYEWSTRQFVYANVSRGYKAAGYNVQMFADLVDKGITNPAATQKEAVLNSISYKPEYSWNYELGGQCLSFNDRLKTAVSLFYINLDNLQLTQFVPNGLGRKISNAGAATSKGVEVSADANLGAGFNAGLNYGYANATFTTYTDSVQITDPTTHKKVNTKVDYNGNHVPYAPQNTLSASASYEHIFKNAFIDRLMATVQYTGVGKIYWTEANDISQDFYSVVNAKVAVSKGGLGVELWAKNLFNTKYNAFYFNSSGSQFFQQGNPMQLGASLKFEF